MKKHLIGVFVLIAVSWSAAIVNGQTTEFVQQGIVPNGYSPNSIYDFEFRLYIEETGGAELGRQSISAVMLEKGSYRVVLDFGNMFDGGDRWLEVAARPSGTAIPFSIVGPREKLTSVPYAIRSVTSGTSGTAESAANAENLGGVPAAEFVQTGDPRMFDERPPSPGSGNYIQNSASVQSTSNFNISDSGSAHILNARSRFELNGSPILFKPPVTRSLHIGVDAGPVSTGDENTFVGERAGGGNTAGVRNSYFGFQAGLNLAGARNSIFGSGSMWGSALNFDDNSFFGDSAASSFSGHRNSFFGRSSGDTTHGNENAFFGFAAGASATPTIGSGNTFVGSRAGYGELITRISFFSNANTLLGSNTRLIGDELSYATALGANAEVRTNNTIVLGRPNGADEVRIAGKVGIGGNAPNAKLAVRTGAGWFTVDGCAGGVGLTLSNDGNSCNENTVLYRTGSDIQFGTPAGGSIAFLSGTTLTASVTPGGRFRITNPADGVAPVCFTATLELGFCSSSTLFKSNVRSLNSGMDLIKRLRPVSFDWVDSGMRDIGLLAEEVAAIEPLLATFNQDGKVQGVKYDRIGVLLLNVVKIQQAQIEYQQRQVDELKLIVCELRPESKVCSQEK